MKTEFEINREAIAIGATYRMTYCSEHRAYSTGLGNHLEYRPWAWYYFRADGLEIAYCIVDLINSVGLFVHEPRHWDKSFVDQIKHSRLELC